MGETTYIMPDNNLGKNDLTSLALLNNGMGNNWMNNPFMYLIWLYMMRWFNNGDNDGSTQRLIQTLQESLQDNHTSDLLMQAILGNNNSLQEAATRIGCDINALSSAVLTINSGIGALGSQVGFSSERIINAVNQGDCNVIQALKDCCCETLKSILQLNYENRTAISAAAAGLKDSINYVGLQVEKGFADTNYLTQAQTCALQNTIRDTGTSNTNAVLLKLDAMLNQALLDKIDQLREKNAEQAVIINNAQLSAQFNLMLNGYTAPIAQSVNVLQAELAGIKCRLPETVTLPYSCATAVPTAFAYGFNSLWG